MIEIDVEIVLTEELLGTKSADPEVFATYIATKRLDKDKHPDPAADELANAEATADQAEESGTTVFHRVDGKPGIYDYQVRGFTKDACGALRQADGTLSKTLTAYKSKIDGLVFVFPRFLVAELPEGGKVGICERPLRAETPRGPRVALCRSETLPVGTKFKFKVRLLAKNLRPFLREWLDYGSLRGLGAWRNSSKGRFSYTTNPELPEKADPPPEE